MVWCHYQPCFGELCYPEFPQGFDPVFQCLWRHLAIVLLFNDCKLPHRAHLHKAGQFPQSPGEKGGHGDLAEDAERGQATGLELPTIQLHLCGWVWHHWKCDPACLVGPIPPSPLERGGGVFQDLDGPISLDFAQNGEFYGNSHFLLSWCRPGGLETFYFSPKVPAGKVGKLFGQHLWQSKSW